MHILPSAVSIMSVDKSCGNMQPRVLCHKSMYHLVLSELVVENDYDCDLEWCGKVWHCWCWRDS